MKGEVAFRIFLLGTYLSELHPLAPRGLLAPLFFPYVDFHNNTINLNDVIKQQCFFWGGGGGEEENNEFKCDNQMSQSKNSNLNIP